MIREILPDAKTVGILYSTNEVNSQAAIEEYKKAAPEFGLEIVESGISTSADIPLAAEQLAAKVDCISNLTDNNVVSSLPVVLEAASKNGIPVFGSEIEQVKRGCLAAMGLDYIALGEQTGRMAAQVLKGEKEASEMPYELIEAQPSTEIQRRQRTLALNFRNLSPPRQQSCLKRFPNNRARQEMR